MLNKRKALSTMGFAIIFVIILGVVMIISAPMMADKYKDKTPKVSEPQPEDLSGMNTNEVPPNLEHPRYMNDTNVNQRYEDRYMDIENRIMSQVDYKIREAMRNFVPQSSDSSVSDKYVCTIEGYMDEEGNVIPINSGNTSDRADQAKVSYERKFVFVCQYRR
ncbi:MAG: hypothetical protein ACLSWI_08150 [Candidatus Gastranaerophilaceae bacterium]